jgi:hypothetical protein
MRNKTKTEKKKKKLFVCGLDTHRITKHFNRATKKLTVEFFSFISVPQKTIPDIIIADVYKTPTINLYKKRQEFLSLSLSPTVGISKS